MWFDEFLYLWCDYIQHWWSLRQRGYCCDLMNFCIFDVITYSADNNNPIKYSLWFDEFLYLWCDYIQRWENGDKTKMRCDLMNFCIFDVITYSFKVALILLLHVVIWWIFVSLMWLHTAEQPNTIATYVLWFDEFLYLWCDYIQRWWGYVFSRIVVIWWIFVSLMWLHTALGSCSTVIV